MVFSLVFNIVMDVITLSFRYLIKKWNKRYNILVKCSRYFITKCNKSYKVRLLLQNEKAQHKLSEKSNHSVEEVSFKWRLLFSLHFMFSKFTIVELANIDKISSSFKNINKIKLIYKFNSLKRQPHKMVKHTWTFWTNYLSIFDHFLDWRLKV